MDAIMKMVLDSKIERWRRMSVGDFPIDVRKEISRYFALRFYEWSFEDVYNELQKALMNGANILSTLNLVDRTMLSTLRYEWGNEVADKVRECIV